MQLFDKWLKIIFFIFLSKSPQLSAAIRSYPQLSAAIRSYPQLSAAIPSYPQLSLAIPRGQNLNPSFKPDSRLPPLPLQVAGDSRG